MMAIIQVETKAAPAVQFAGRQIIPFSQVVRLNLPGSTLGGILWNRPVAVLVQEQDGSERVIPISDITRMAQIFLLGLGLFSAFIIWVAHRSQTEEIDSEEK
jgi:hypothetical protein